MGEQTKSNKSLRGETYSAQRFFSKQVVKTVKRVFYQFPAIIRKVPLRTHWVIPAGPGQGGPGPRRAQAKGGPGQGGPWPRRAQAKEGPGQGGPGQGGPGQGGPGQGGPSRTGRELRRSERSKARLAVGAPVLVLLPAFGGRPRLFLM